MDWGYETYRVLSEERIEEFRRDAARDALARAAARIGRHGHAGVLHRASRRIARLVSGLSRIRPRRRQGTAAPLPLAPVHGMVAEERTRRRG